jgi:hypothetical protein
MVCQQHEPPHSDRANRALVMAAQADRPHPGKQMPHKPGGQRINFHTA